MSDDSDGAIRDIRTTPIRRPFSNAQNDRSGANSAISRTRSDTFTNRPGPNARS